jgi:hypothetical protein
MKTEIYERDKGALAIVIETIDNKATVVLYSKRDAVKEGYELWNY